jgi:hypothetical protein
MEKEETTAKSLERQMKKAVDEQKYEKAARLRDAIKARLADKEAVADKRKAEQTKKKDERAIAMVERKMKQAAAKMEFEDAARLRDAVNILNNLSTKVLTKGSTKGPQNLAVPERPERPRLGQGAVAGAVGKGEAKKKEESQRKEQAKRSVEDKAVWQRKREEMQRHVNSLQEEVLAAASAKSSLEEIRKRSEEDKAVLQVVAAQRPADGSGARSNIRKEIVDVTMDSDKDHQAETLVETKVERSRPCSAAAYGGLKRKGDDYMSEDDLPLKKWKKARVLTGGTAVAKGKGDDYVSEDDVPLKKLKKARVSTGEGMSCVCISPHCFEFDDKSKPP